VDQNNPYELTSSSTSALHPKRKMGKAPLVGSEVRRSEIGSREKTRASKPHPVSAKTVFVFIEG
jgi:hypothetical protein